MLLISIFLSFAYFVSYSCKELLINIQPFTYFANYYSPESCWSEFFPYMPVFSVTIVQNAVDKQFFIIKFCDDMDAAWIGIPGTMWINS